MKWGKKVTLSINELKEQSDTDCSIDTNKLDKYSLDLAKTTSRWTQYLLDEKLVWENQFMKYSILKRKKWEYYNADYHLIINKGKELDLYLDSDIELLKVKEKLTISKEKLVFIENTIKTLNTSSFNVRNAIEWIKFQSGAY